jgi:hypothetical protein
MCDPVGAVTKGIGDVIGAVMKPFTPQVPQAPQAPTPEKPPELQAAKAPDQAALRGAAAGGATPGSAGSTLLTGGQGVAPSLLSLGKNTLLGQ